MPSGVYGMTQEFRSVMTGGENTSSQIPQNSECILNLSPSIRKKKQNEIAPIQLLLNSNKIKCRTYVAFTEDFCFSDLNVCLLELYKWSQQCLTLRSDLPIHQSLLSQVLVKTLLIKFTQDRMIWAMIFKLILVALYYHCFNICYKVNIFT